MTGFGLQAATFVLLLFTTYLSIQTQIFQVRTGIRESLEQLDDYEFRRGSLKLKPILHRFKYRGPWSESEVLVKWRNPGNHATTSQIHGNPFWWLKPGEKDDFCRAIENLEKVPECDWDDRAVRFTVQSKDPVVVRRTVETVHRLIETSHRNQK